MRWQAAVAASSEKPVSSWHRFHRHLWHAGCWESLQSTQGYSHVFYSTMWWLFFYRLLRVKAYPPLLHPPPKKRFPVTGIMSEECGPVPFPLHLCFCPALNGPFLSLPPERRIWVCLYVGRQSGTQTHSAHSAVSLAQSVPVIPRVQRLLSPDLWPFLPRVPRGRKTGLTGGQREKERKKDWKKERKDTGTFKQRKTEYVRDTEDREKNRWGKKHSKSNKK